MSARTRILAALLAVLLLAVSVVAGASSAARPAQSGGGPPALAKKKAKKKLCVVQVVKNGKLVDYVTTHLVVKRVHGKLRVVRAKTKLRAACSPKPCVVQKNGKVVFVKKRQKVPVIAAGKVRKVTRNVKVPRIGACSRTPLAPTANGTAIHIDVLPDSTAKLDFGSFVRTPAIQGSLGGLIPGKLDLSKDIDFVIDRGSIDVAPTGIFIDDACNGQVSPSIRTGPSTQAVVDQSKTSSGTSSPDGSLFSTVSVQIQLALELRNGDDGCDKPYITTGYSTTPISFTFTGTLDLHTFDVHLTSVPKEIPFSACISPGAVGSPCNGFEIPFPVLGTFTIHGTFGLGAS